ncbi:NAD(P)H-quinone oxidoreductase [Persicimonas caeni]|uniref:NAD(P)H-quinone oxidoreductase n=1 Tax=Persicimonas caeni TaxID=2292766 RepID=A0A4Y6Q266_PERCE|nr:NAD(P)H-quinone oxidoreductase [Persicimonas caeni]QDG54684.1 NAD(P)H-quinone oxidoreductase [Persicimonas caeni]QED35905.1 NAD(P)H-quinone oxidoreductase [Persicimonas caeni]
MKAIQVRDDEQHTLVWEEVDTPSLGPGEVLIKAAATAVNRADLLQRRGLYPVPEGASPIMGLEVSGTIAKLGEGVEGYQIGDRVCALLAGGGYAEYVVVPADMLLSVPASIDLVEAAAIPEVFYTAFLNIFLEANQSEGERVLVHAGASGVGTAAIQLCRVFDSPVYATASASKLDFLRELGVEAAIDRHEEDFAERIDELTDGEGVDIILDPVAADYLDRNTRILKKCGRLVIIGLLSGTKAELSLSRLLMKRLRVIGSVLRSRSPEEKVEITSRFRQEVWPWFESGELSPVIYRMLPITSADEAHDILRNNENVGKVVLRIS